MGSVDESLRREIELLREEIRAVRSDREGFRKAILRRLGWENPSDVRDVKDSEVVRKLDRLTTVASNMAAALEAGVPWLRELVASTCADTEDVSDRIALDKSEDALRDYRVLERVLTRK